MQKGSKEQQTFKVDRKKEAFEGAMGEGGSPEVKTGMRIGNPEVLRENGSVQPSDQSRWLP